jgi:hypothetical protein
MADEKPNNIFVRRLKDEEQQPKHANTNFYFYSLYFDTTRDWMYPLRTQDNHSIHYTTCAVQFLWKHVLVVVLHLSVSAQIYYLVFENHLIKYNLFLPWYRWKIITRSRKLSSWYSRNIAHLALIIITHSTKTELDMSINLFSLSCGSACLWKKHQIQIFIFIVFILTRPGIECVQMV